MQEYLPYAIVAAAITAVFFILSSGTNAKVKPDSSGNFILRMNKIYLWGGLVSLLLFTIITLVYLPKFQFQQIDQIHLILIIDLIAIPLSFYSILCYYRHKVVFNADELNITSSKGYVNTLNWEDIKTIDYNGFNSSIKIRTKDDNTLKVNQHLVGFKSFVEMLDGRTDLGSLKILKTKLRMD